MVTGNAHRNGEHHAHQSGTLQQHLLTDHTLPFDHILQQRPELAPTMAGISPELSPGPGSNHSVPPRSGHKRPQHPRCRRRSYPGQRLVEAEIVDQAHHHMVGIPGTAPVGIGVRIEHQRVGHQLVAVVLLGDHAVLPVDRFGALRFASSIRCG